MDLVRGPWVAGDTLLGVRVAIVGYQLGTLIRELSQLLISLCFLSQHMIFSSHSFLSAMTRHSQGKSLLEPASHCLDFQVSNCELNQFSFQVTQLLEFCFSNRKQNNKPNILAMANSISSRQTFPNSQPFSFSGTHTDGASVLIFSRDSYFFCLLVSNTLN